MPANRTVDMHILVCKTKKKTQAGTSDKLTERRQPSHRELSALKYLTSAGAARARAPPELPSETETEHKREAAD